MKLFKLIIKKPLLSFTILVIVVVVSSVIVVRLGRIPQHDVVIAELGNVVQEVSVTGKVEPVQGVDLAFEEKGRVRSIEVVVGNDVYRGQALVRLEVYDLLAQLSEAEANVTAEKIELQKLERGPRSEEIAVKETELAEVARDLENSYDDIIDILGDAYTKADDAVRTKTSAMFSGSEAGHFTLTFVSCDIQAKNDATFLRLGSGITLNTWKQELQLLEDGSIKDELEAALLKARAYLKGFRNFLERTNANLITGCTINDSSFDAYRTSISTARTNITAALISVNNLKQTIAAEQVTVERKQKELEQLIAGASEDELAIQRAVVTKTEAQEALIRAKIEKKILRAPFAGTVTKVDVNLGELVSADKVIVSIVSNAGFEIEAPIPEVDIAKVKIGDRARVTLDAYGNREVFEAEIISLDTAETVIDGVSTYTATLRFIIDDERIKSGMTANVDVLTASREHVLSIPQRAVITQGSTLFVRLLKNKEVRMVEVSTGLRGSDGTIEITEGIIEGDVVVLFLAE